MASYGHGVICGHGMPCPYGVIHFRAKPATPLVPMLPHGNVSPNIIIYDTHYDYAANAEELAVEN